ncbi:MAG: inverse autotransporter beta domain-containing protein [Pseudomonadota bacterium]
MKLKTIAFLSPTLLSIAISAQASSLSEGRIQSSVAEANTSLTIVSGDGMLPIYENSSGFVYGDLMGDYASDATYLMSPGIGYRAIEHNQILGAYAFVDYEKTNLGTNFWVLSPGVEWITPTWDAHINGYFPTESAQQVGDSEDASNYGLYGDQYQTYTDGSHWVTETMFAPYAVLGNGIDTEVGYSFSQDNDLRSRIFLGGYYYHPQASYDLSNIVGGTIGFEQSLSEHFSASLMSSYDNVNRSILGINITATFGGASNHYSSDVADRLLDPVQRHVGIIDTGAGAYDQQTIQQNGEDHYYVYFGTPDGKGDGSYNHAGPIDQASLDATYDASPEGALFYIQGGDEVVYSLTALNPYDGQDFYGRTADYMAPASTDERPDLEFTEGSNGFVLRGGENTFSDLNIFSHGDGIGIYDSNNGSGDSTLTINNTTIFGFATGVYVVNDNTTPGTPSGDFIINVTNSQLNDNHSADSSVSGMEVWNQDSGTVTINIADSEFNNNDGASSASGLYVVNSGSGDTALNVTNSKFNQNNAADFSFGMYVSNSGSGTLTSNINQSTFNGNTVSGTGANVYGMYAVNTDSGYMQLNVANSFFNENATNSSSSAYGVSLTNASSEDLIFNASDSEFSHNMAGTDGNGLGMLAYNPYNTSGHLIVSATNSKFNSNSLDGMSVINQSSSEGSLQITNLSGSTFNNNVVYGIYDATTPPDPDGATAINITDAVFEDNGFDNYNWP